MRTNKMPYDPSTPIAVFLGPSLEVDAARSILPANYYPPVQLGDVYRLLATGVETIVIIDGLFHATTPIWQREILAALEKQITVIGASSMGALRAAETWHFGMIGYGTIFEWYRDGVVDGDDEVALLHGDESWGFQAVSEPLVNIRYNLQLAVEQGLIDDLQRQQLVDTAKGWYFGDRNYEALLAHRICSEWTEETRKRLATFLQDEGVNLKRQDAITALEFCAKGAVASDRGSNANPNRLEIITPSDSSFMSAEALWRGMIREGDVLSATFLLERVAEDTDMLSEALFEASSRFFINDWMRRQSISPDDDYVRQFIANWHEQYTGGDVASWLRTTGLTELELQQELTERAAIEWLLDLSPERFAIPFADYQHVVAGMAQAYARADDGISSSMIPSQSMLTHEAARCAYISAWARTNGVTCPDDIIETSVISWENDHGITCREDWLALYEIDEDSYLRVWVDRALADWIIDKGPPFFGYDLWSFDVCVLRELQTTNRITPLTALNTEVTS